MSHPNVRSNARSMPLLRMLTAAVMAGLCSGFAAHAQDAPTRFQSETFRIVGSSTIFPYNARVVEEFSSFSDVRIDLAGTGSGGGFQEFCRDVTLDTPSVTGASRKITAEEAERCAQNGVSEILELQIGLDGIVVATSFPGDPEPLTLTHLYQALAAETVQDRTITLNQYTNWSQIDPALSDRIIKFYGPPSTSGTRDMFETLAMGAGCRGFSAIEALDPPRRAKVCTTIRFDDVYETLGEDDLQTIRALKNDPRAYGIFGFSYAERDKAVRAVPINGVMPDFITISEGEYPLARPLFLYVKADHLPRIRDLKAFLTFYLSETTVGPQGFLIDAGLVPASDTVREDARKRLGE